MKFMYCVLAILLPILKAGAMPVEPLTIGDKVPALPLANIVNAPYKNSSTNVWQGKLLVLDFIATTCKGCILALPRLDSLQIKYKDRIQIFLVTYEDAASVKSFITRNHIGQQVHLPFVTSDTLLAKYFPHTWLSHEAWINSKQQVFAITEAEYVNDKNISEALTGAPVSWPLKMDLQLYDAGKPLLTYNDADSFYFKKPASAFYTFFSSYVNTRATSFLFKKDTINNVKRFCITNYPIVQMYQLACNDIDLPHGHIQLQVKNKLHYVYEKGAEYLDVWNSKNRYCYEALLPFNTTKEAVQQKIIADLNNYFGLQSTYKKQETSCLVLKDTIKQKAVEIITDTTQSHSITLANLLYVLNDNRYGTPVINESSANSDLILPLSGNETIDEINKVLGAYGLVFLKLVRNTQMLTITETSAPE